jgi:hypothetical protein
MIMKIYNLTEEDTVSNDLINLLMGKVSSESSKTLSPKDIQNVKKYTKNIWEKIMISKMINIH